MSRDELLEQARQLCLLQPGLSLVEATDGIDLSGTYVLNSFYGDIPLYDEYTVKIVIPWTFPVSIPSIWETGGKVPREKAFGHFLDNGQVCLGASCDLVTCIVKAPTVTHYVCTLLDSYLYSSSYFVKYGVIPDFGDRSHGVKGLIEAYKEHYDVTDDDFLLMLLLYLVKFQPYRGHIQCPCHSGKKFRGCHGKIVLQDLSSQYHPLLCNDALVILTHFYKEKASKNE